MSFIAHYGGFIVSGLIIAWVIIRQMKLVIPKWFGATYTTAMCLAAIFYFTSVMFHHLT